LGGCAMPSLESDPQRAVEAHALYADLVEGRDDALLARMTSTNDPAVIRAQLPMIRTFAPAGPPPQPKPLGWTSNASTSGQRYALAQEYDYPDRFVRTDTTFLKQGETWKVESFNVNARMKPAATAAAVEPAGATDAP
jgi:hypothetical protein